MPNFILTKLSVIICPHGGMVMHISKSAGAKLNGEAPLLVNDFYTVAGCPFTKPNGASPCHFVTWNNPSKTVQFGGVPALTNASVGTVQSFGGIPQGLVVVLTHQTVATD